MLREALGRRGPLTEVNAKEPAGEMDGIGVQPGGKEGLQVLKPVGFRYDVSDQ